MKRVTKAILKSVYRKRPLWSHKGDYGRLLVIGGSNLYTGAPFLVGLAALRSGCDLVTIAAPERAVNISVKNFNLIKYPLTGEYLIPKHLNQIDKFTKRCNAVVIGNGLGREDKTVKAILEFLGKNKLPVVIDADAIYAISKKRKLAKKAILTPHEGEFKIITGKSVSKNLKERVSAVKKEAKKLNCVILLKGHVDVISNGERTCISNSGNPFMTKGGTGDVLAGICGSLLAQGIASFDAACAAAYISGVAGTLTAKEKKQSLLATDVIEKIPKAIS